MDFKIACIGSGNMGTALMKAAAASCGAENTGFTDSDKPKAKAAAKALGAEVYASNREAAEKADFVFLAVKPQALSPVLEEIAPVIQKRMDAKKPPVLVSMAAGWGIVKIQSLLNLAGTHGYVPKRLGPDWMDMKSAIMPEKPVPVLRIMPNTPALIGKGMIAMAASPQVPADKLAALEKFLSKAGRIDYIEERYLDAVTGLSGSGSAFVYMFIEALADGGVQAGLPRDKALNYAAQTVLGSAAMVQETGLHPGELKDMVTSPAGTTIAGVSALEKAAFRGAVMGAVEAAWRWAEKLGKS
ncbi:MAG: pyrroline-5-carboxylate reductase [Treponema sp.]|jgi:pyrroline-5-carboxylate reductase|nr:pyrroline-5-carboxylate reductase [Treponema sp.]